MPDAGLIQEILDRDSGHLHTPFSTLPSFRATPEGALPYLDLGGPGFERLLFLLLLADGHAPRYFGRSGQAQYGIDLVVPVDDTHHVYQCKNTATFPPAAMRDALTKFEAEWLSRDDLPRPSCFVLCCSADLRGHEEAWSVEAEAFRQRTGVVATLWERSVFNERLRRLPDIVADVFSDAAAERFCEQEAWAWDLFRPLRPGTGAEAIEHFLRLRGSGVLDLPETLQARFDTMLAREDAVLVRGAPGSGKTTTGLALAANFTDKRSNSRTARGSWRVFHLDLAHEWSESEVVHAVQQRLSRPTIFVFDDGHRCVDRLPSLHRRLDALLAGQSTARRIYLLRHTAAPAELLRDASELEELLDASGAVLDLTPDLATVRRITHRLAPDWPPLRPAQVERLATVCAHDLTLLTQILATVETPETLENLDLEQLYPDLLRRFCGRLPVDLPALRAVACLGQFEINPPLPYKRHDLEAELASLPTELLTIAGRPPRRIFFHASGAELVFRALCWQDGEDQPIVVMGNVLSEFLASQQTPWTTLLQVLDGELRLATADELNALRQIVLTSPALVGCIASAGDELPLRVLGHAWRFAPEVYSDAFLQLITSGALLRHLQRAAASELPFVLRSLLDTIPQNAAAAAPAEDGSTVLAGIMAEHVRQDLDQVVRRTSASNLCYLLAYLGRDEPAWLQAVSALDTEAIEAMLDATLATERASSMILKTLRTLRGRRPHLAKALRQRLGTDFFLRTLRHDGSIVELLRLVQQTSWTLGTGLLASLTAEDFEALTVATISQRRSIGTLDLTLRALSAKRRQAVETRLLPHTWWHLLGHLGDLAILAGILRRLSKGYRFRLLKTASDDGTRARERMRIVRTGLLQRSTLPQLGHFLRRHSFAVPSLFPRNTDAQVSEPLAAMLARTDWETLRYGHHLILGAPKTTFRNLCLQTIRDHLASVDVGIGDSSLCLPNLAEATSFLRLLQSALPDRLPEILPLLDRLLPSPHTWLQDLTADSEPHTLRQLRGLFHLLADERVPATLADQALELALGPHPACLCREVDALEVLLYLWNALSLACARHPADPIERTGEHFSRELQEVVIEKLAQPPTTPDEIDQAVSLVGLTSFLGWTGTLGSVDSLDWPSETPLPSPERVEAKGLVTGGFYLLGLQRLGGEVEAEHWRSVRQKVDDFATRSRAVELLLQAVELPEKRS